LKAHTLNSYDDNLSWNLIGLGEIGGLAIIKRILILIPVACLLVVLVMAKQHFDDFSYANTLLNTAPLLFIIGADFIYKQRQSAAAGFIQASFYFYLLGVLSLTVFYINYLAIFEAAWAGNFRLNPELADFNLTLFNKFKIFSVYSRQVIGNSIMLLPLGIYIPILYRRINTLGQVFLASLLFSTGLEIAQYLGSVFTASVTANVPGLFYTRVFDIDDIFLNTVGAVVGFLLFWFYKKMGGRVPDIKLSK